MNPRNQHPLLSLTPQARRELARTLLEGLADAQAHEAAELSRRGTLAGLGSSAALGVAYVAWQALTGAAGLPFLGFAALGFGVTAGVGRQLAGRLPEGPLSETVLAPYHVAAWARAIVRPRRVGADRLVLAAGLLSALRRPVSLQLVRRLYGRAFAQGEVDSAIALLERSGHVAQDPSAGTLGLTPAGAALLRELGVAPPTPRLRQDPQIAAHLVPVFAALAARSATAPALPRRGVDLPHPGRAPAPEAPAVFTPPSETPLDPPATPSAAEAYEASFAPSPSRDAAPAAPALEADAPAHAAAFAPPEAPAAAPFVAEPSLPAEPALAPAAEPSLAPAVEPPFVPSESPSADPSPAAGPASSFEELLALMDEPTALEGPVPDLEAPLPWETEEDFSPEAEPFAAAEGAEAPMPWEVLPGEAGDEAPPLDAWDEQAEFEPSMPWEAPSEPWEASIATASLALPPSARPDATEAWSLPEARPEAEAAPDASAGPSLPRPRKQVLGAETGPLPRLSRLPSRRVLRVAALVALLGALAGLAWTLLPRWNAAPPPALSAAPMPASRGTALQFNGRGQLLSAFGGGLFLSVPDRLDYKRPLSFKGYDMAAACGLVDHPVRFASVAPLGRFMWCDLGGRGAGGERCLVDQETRTVTHDLGHRNALYALPTFVGWAGPRAALLSEETPGRPAARWWRLDVTNHQAVPVELPHHARVLPASSDADGMHLLGLDLVRRGEWSVTRYWLDPRGVCQKLSALTVRLPEAYQEAEPLVASLSPDKRYALWSLRPLAAGQPVGLVAVDLTQGRATPLVTDVPPVANTTLFWGLTTTGGRYRFYYNGEGPSGPTPCAGELRVEANS